MLERKERKRKKRKKIVEKSINIEDNHILLLFSTIRVHLKSNVYCLVYYKRHGKFNFNFKALYSNGKLTYSVIDNTCCHCFKSISVHFIQLNFGVLHFIFF